MRKLILALVFVLVASTSFAEPFLVDGFESADMSTTNSDGFSWDVNNKTSIVTVDDEDGSVAVYNNGPIYNIQPGNDWYAYEGDYSLRFRYAAGEAWSEQRFNLGGEYPELWISYWLRVPINYIHGTLDRPPGHRGQKFNAFWTYQYESDQPLVVPAFWDLVDAWNEGETEGVSYCTVGIYPSGTPHNAIKKDYKDFIIFPEDQGRWMHTVMRLKVSSYNGAEDGVFQWWRRWSDEDDHTLLVDIQDIGWDTTEGHPDGWSAGYLMGWALGQYTEDTEFLIDDFKLSESSLLEEGLTLLPPSFLRYGTVQYK